MRKVIKLLDFFASFLSNYIFLRKYVSSEHVYLFLPRPARPSSENILFYLSQDIVDASDSKILLVRSYLRLAFNVIRDPAPVVCMHYTHYPLLYLVLHRRIPLSCFYTHNRFYSTRSSWLNKAETIFFQSYSDLACSYCSNKSTKHIHFPVGLKKSFIPAVSLLKSPRQYDILFSSLILIAIFTIPPESATT